MFSALNRISIIFAFSTIFILTSLRIIILLTFGEGQSYTFNELLDVFFLALRFDLKLIATILLIVVYVPAIFMLRFKNAKFLFVIRNILFVLFLIIGIFAFIQFGYYLFFGNGIDILIFGIINDGTKEVFDSMFADQRLVKILVASIVFVLVLSYLYLKTKVQLVVVANKSWKQYLSLFLVIVFMFLLARGSISTFPLSRKVANATDNAFLNSMTFGPLWNLLDAYSDRQRNDFKLTSKQILNLAHVPDFETLKKEAGYNETNKLKVKTPKNDFLKKNPPHVIFVQQEGWSTDIGRVNDKENNTLGEFAKHAKEDYLYESFFSNAYGTSPTLNNILLNSPISGLSQSRASKVSFTTSSVLPFKENGYSITFLSGGSSSWRNHNIYWPRQGFDRYIGRTTIEEYYNYVCDNPWGVYEEYTFKYLKKLLIENIESGKPSFTYVLTTNNHGPIMLPDTFKEPTYNMKKLGFKQDDKGHYTQLIGYLYQTDAFGRFLTWLKSSKYKDKVIIVATGDHILKGYKNYSKPKMEYLKYAVLTYFYVPKQYDRLKNIPKDIVGSHNDLFPTLYELALSDTSYYNFGQAIMYKNKENEYGWQENEVFMFHDGVVSKDLKLDPWDSTQKHRSFLSGKKIDATQKMKETIEKTKKQILLKKYILVKEYEMKDYDKITH